MARDLKNKVVVITGGAQGIGFDIATKFLDKGARTIIIVDINEEGKEAARILTTTYGDNKADFIKCDVTTDLDEVSKKIFDTYKTVDVLVNSAGIIGGFSATNDIHNKKVLDINVTALTLWSFKFWEHMRKDKGGKGGTVINLGSTCVFEITPVIPVYTASKYAVVGLTRSLGHMYNYNRSGVRVVVLCPGFTETNMTRKTKIFFEKEQLQDVGGGRSSAVDERKADNELQEDYVKLFKDYYYKDFQKVDAVGRGAVQVFEGAESGTAWIIYAGKPAVEVKFTNMF